MSFFTFCDVADSPGFRSKLGLVFGIDALVAQAQFATFHTLDGRRLQGPEIDHLVKQPMDMIRIPGLALALLENNKISHLKTYGYRNLETHAPLETTTAMYAALFSKAVFACLAMQLVQEKRLDLDKVLDLFQNNDKGRSCRAQRSISRGVLTQSGQRF